MDLFLVTGFPTIDDPNTIFAHGLVVAANANQAANAVIEALRVTGLDIDNSDSDLVTIVPWPKDTEGVTLIFG